MLKQTISFTDFNDQDQHVVEYFHISKAELIDLESREEGGLGREMQAVFASGEAVEVLNLIRRVIALSYGKKSIDGLHFEKSPELLKKFQQSAYYDDFLFSLLENDGEKATIFVKGILPAKLLAQAEEHVRQIKAGQAEVTPPEEIRQYAPSSREVFAQAQEAKTLPVQPIISGPSEIQAQEEKERQEFLAWKAAQNTSDSFGTDVTALPHQQLGSTQ